MYAGRLPERDHPGPERPGRLPDQQPGQRRALRVQRRLLLPEGSQDRVHQRPAGHGGITGRRVQPGTDFQNGDLDFDGQSYLPDWPNGSRNFPTTFQYIGPFTNGGHTYPLIQFETDVAGSENLCNITTGVGCTAPPIGAKFYPFWSLSPLFGGMGGHSAVCVWNFGNDQPNTLLDFGKTAQYGVPNLARYGGTLISAPTPNPQFTGRCKG